jgi:hypothetical protein
MPYDELLDWFEYFDRRPIGWREDDRASKQIQAAGVKAKPEQLFPSLKRIYKPDKKYKPEQTLTQSVKGSWMEMMINHATGGDKIPL